jgi:hypothetical protein
LTALVLVKQQQLEAALGEVVVSKLALEVVPVIGCYHESHLANCMSTKSMGGGCHISNIPHTDCPFMALSGICDACYL